MSLSSSDTFPRQYARTRRFTLGEPRSFRISPDGERIVYLRSAGGSDSLNALWCADVSLDNQLVERLVADPRLVLAAADQTESPDLPAAERARRERQREQADGITAFATDAAVTTAAYTLGGRLFVTDLLSGTSWALSAADGAFDPRVSPDGQWVGYVSNRCLRVTPVRPDADPGSDRLLAGELDESVSWGAADFIAAEELHRFRGYWWSPDSSTIVAARVDESTVLRWFISDPANPEREPVVHRYPAAGTANAIVTLAVIDVSTGMTKAVTWDTEAFPYVVEVTWVGTGLFSVVMNRAQNVQVTFAMDPATGDTERAHETTGDAWVELAPGTPAWLADGRLVTSAEYNDEAVLFGSLALVVGGQRLTPPGMQLRRVVDADANRIVFTASTDTGTAVTGYIADIRGPSSTPRPFTSTVGVIDATAAGSLAVVRTAELDGERPRVEVVRLPATEHEGPLTIGELKSLAETPLLRPKVSLHALVERGINVAVLLPSGTTASGTNGERLPVLLDPYGGPHAQRVVASRNAYLSSQWFADQGFAVVVIDGRGTPGWGPKHEKAVHLDLATPILEDQVSGLQLAAQIYPQLDMTRVAIRGWSFGGYLAALAVLRRPDIFHAAVVGAPVTDWRLYDTAYSERYLGHPGEDPGPYDRCSVLLEAHALTRPVMLVHGLADDNVVAAHTLRFSSALLAAGRPHEVLPLSGVTHMTPQEVVAENLLLLQVEFLKRSLGVV